MECRTSHEGCKGETWRGAYVDSCDRGLRAGSWLAERRLPNLRICDAAVRGDAAAIYDKVIAAFDNAEEGARWRVLRASCHRRSRRCN